MHEITIRGAPAALLLGIDPGFASLGWALVEVQLDEQRAAQLVAVGVLRTKKAAKKKHALSSDDNVRRARELFAGLSALEQVWRPALLCVEAMSYPRNASAAAKMSIAWGVVAALAELRELTVLQCSPQQLKVAACGAKDASKLDVLAALTRRYPTLILKLADTPRGQWEHPVDALGAVHAALNTNVVKTLREGAQQEVVS